MKYGLNMAFVFVVFIVVVLHVVVFDVHVVVVDPRNLPLKFG